MSTRSPKYVYVLIPRAWAYVIFFGKKDLADVMKLRILRRDHPGGLNVIKRVLRGEKQTLGGWGRVVRQSGKEV